MQAEFFGECCALFHAGYNPECVSKEFAIGFGAEWVLRFAFRRGDDIEKAFHIGIVNKLSVGVYSEKFAEVERFVAISIAFGEFAKVEGENLQARQFFVWIWVARAFVGPPLFGALLHDVVPSEGGLFVVLVEQVEGRPREVELFGFAFGNQAFDHLLAEFGLCAFVRFVHHQKVTLVQKFRCFCRNCRPPLASRANLE